MQGLMYTASVLTNFLRVTVKFLDGPPRQMDSYRLLSTCSRVLLLFRTAGFYFVFIKQHGTAAVDNPIEITLDLNLRHWFTIHLTIYIRLNAEHLFSYIGHCLYQLVRLKSLVSDLGISQKYTIFILSGDDLAKLKVSLVNQQLLT